MFNRVIEGFLDRKVKWYVPTCFYFFILIAAMCKKTDVQPHSQNFVSGWASTGIGLVGWPSVITLIYQNNNLGRGEGGGQSRWDGYGPTTSSR